MRLLIVIGAGASFDYNPFNQNPHSDITDRLPLARDLFSSMPVQNAFLQKYNLVGLAGILRSKAKDDNFNVEAELAKINTDAQSRNDNNRLQDLFATRFYLHGLINELTNKSLAISSSHTVYIDLLNQLKTWIDESPSTRFADLVVFNYDSLIEKAMETVYRYDWKHKNTLPLKTYYAGENLRVYKPHGSINWGREIIHNSDSRPFRYYSVNQVIDEYQSISFNGQFQIIGPDSITSRDVGKNYIPAIAIPFANKTDFKDCPIEMYESMVEAIKKADKMITLGWKGGDNHFIKLLLDNNKSLSDIYVVSPKGDTQLEESYSADVLHRLESTLSYFVSTTTAFNDLLNRL